MKREKGKESDISQESSDKIQNEGEKKSNAYRTKNMLQFFLKVIKNYLEIVGR